MFAVFLIVNVRDEHAEVPVHPSRDVAMVIAELAAELHARWLASEARGLADQHARGQRPPRARLLYLRDLGARLGHHLEEQQRALERGASATLARANALSLARAVVRTGERSAARSFPACEALGARLATGRTKFLMANTADALLALDEQLAGDAHPRRELHEVAARAREAIAGRFLGELEERVAADVERTAGEVARGLLAELDSALQDLGEHVSPHAFAGFDRVVIRRPGHARRSPPSRRGGLGWFASRRWIVARARRELVDTLAAASRHVVDAALADCEAACAALARRLDEHLDAAIESVLIAMQLAEHAQRDGHAHLSRTRQRLEGCAQDLQAILASLE